MRVVRVYHGARDPAHRAREAALVRAGVELRLVLPAAWPGPSDLGGSPCEHVELPVVRAGDVNRHRYEDGSRLAAAVTGFRPDVLDVHEEPVSVVARQALATATGTPTVMYSAQNLDKRWPPPFQGYERAALRKVAAFYPCSRQAASVLRGKGYAGPLEVLPLGIDATVNSAGSQEITQGPLVLGLVGRLVPEKGLAAALEVLASLQGATTATLLVVGQGPDQQVGHDHARRLGVQHLVEWHPWVSAETLARLYQRMHVVLVPSVPTSTWVEQFGRVITEGGANGAVPVGYASGSIAEVVADTGIVVAPGDVAALSRSVLALHTQPELWRRLRTRGLERAVRWSWDAVAARQVQIYEQALSTRVPPALGPRDRTRAGEEFGPPAFTSVSSRPFALPVLRDSARVHALAERLPLLRR